MALKNPRIFPQFCVYVWKEKQNLDGTWEADRFCVDRFNSELEAYGLYKTIHLVGGIVEVDLEKDTDDDCFPVRHKDSAGECIY